MSYILSALEQSNKRRVSLTREAGTQRFTPTPRTGDGRASSWFGGWAGLIGTAAVIVILMGVMAMFLMGTDFKIPGFFWKLTVALLPVTVSSFQSDIEKTVRQPPEKRQFQDFSLQTGKNALLNWKKCAFKTQFVSDINAGWR